MWWSQYCSYPSSGSVYQRCTEDCWLLVVHTVSQSVVAKLFAFKLALLTV